MRKGRDAGSTDQSKRLSEMPTSTITTRARNERRGFAAPVSMPYPARPARRPQGHCACTRRPQTPRYGRPPALGTDPWVMSNDLTRTHWKQETSRALMLNLLSPARIIDDGHSLVRYIYRDSPEPQRVIVSNPSAHPSLHLPPPCLCARTVSLVSTLLP